MTKRAPLSAECTRGLATALNAVAETRQGLGDLEGAAKGVTESAELFGRVYEQGAKSNVEDLRGLSFSIRLLSQVLLAQGKAERSTELLREALEHNREILRRSPGDTEMRANMISGLYRLSDLVRQQGRFDESVAALKEMVEIKKARRQGPNFERELKALEDAVAVEIEISAMIKGERAPKNASEMMLLAYAYADSGQDLKAQLWFERGLRPGELSEDTRRSHLFNAARSASRASRTDAGRAKALLERAMGWLGEDLRYRIDRLTQLRKQILAKPGPEETKRLRGEGSQHKNLVEFARTKDPDLAPLRALPGFEALFEGEPPP